MASTFWNMTGVTEWKGLGLPNKMGIIINVAKIKGNFVSEIEFVRTQKLWKALCGGDVPIKP